MLEQAEKAVKVAQKHGCTYCDARAEIIEKHGILVENGQVEHLFTRNEQGIGIRVLCDGAWGFYSTSDFERVEQGIIDAVKSAKHYATKKRNRVTLAETPTAEKKIKYNIKKSQI
jgi:TldD protein